MLGSLAASCVLKSVLRKLPPSYNRGIPNLPIPFLACLETLHCGRSRASGRMIEEERVTIKGREGSRSASCGSSTAMTTWLPEGIASGRHGSQDASRWLLCVLLLSIMFCPCSSLGPARNHPWMLTTLGCQGSPDPRNSRVEKL